MSTILFLIVLALVLVSLMAVLAIHDRRQVALVRELERARQDERRVHVLVEDYLEKGLRTVLQNSGYPEGSVNQIMLLESCKRIEAELVGKRPGLTRNEREERAS